MLDQGPVGRGAQARRGARLAAGRCLRLVAPRAAAGRASETSVASGTSCRRRRRCSSDWSPRTTCSSRWRIGGPFVYGTASTALSRGRDAARGRDLGAVARARRVAGGDALGRGPGPGGLHAWPTSPSCSARRCAARELVLGRLIAGAAGLGGRGSGRGRRSSLVGVAGDHRGVDAGARGGFRGRDRDPRPARRRGRGARGRARRAGTAPRAVPPGLRSRSRPAGPACATPSPSGPRTSRCGRDRGAGPCSRWPGPAAAWPAASCCWPRSPRRSPRSPCAAAARRRPSATSCAPRPAAARSRRCTP